jgi:hypothetical protein
MVESPEEFRYVFPSGATSFEFRAVSVPDAIAFTALHFCPGADETAIRARLQCRIGGEWTSIAVLHGPQDAG